MTWNMRMGELLPETAAAEDQEHEEEEKRQRRSNTDPRFIACPSTAKVHALIVQVRGAEPPEPSN